MKILSLLLISFALLSITQQAVDIKWRPKQGLQAQEPWPATIATIATPPAPTDGCTANSLTHWIFALDESGSMAGTQWTNLKNLMNDIADVTTGRMSVFTFDNVATVPPSEYYLFNSPAGWDSSVLPSSPSGDTDFGEPILRAISIILEYRNSHTCFVMITDGQAPYPEFEIAIYNSVRAWMNDRRCRTCAYCYFIKEKSNSVVPDSYKRLCESIGAQTPIPRGRSGPGSVRTSISVSAVAAVEGKTLDSQILESLQARQSLAQGFAA